MREETEVIKVLLIDDDEDDYILTRELLTGVKLGKYALDWAHSYEEGLRVAGRREHHVCLVDYRLGERSGVQLIREARESRLTTPMILLTGQGNHNVDVEAMQAGATDYLVKDEPHPERLERTIRYAVQLNAERCRAEEALEAYGQKQAVVAEIGRLALTGGELKDLFAEAVCLIARTLGVEYCKVLELLPEGDVFILRAGVGWKEGYPVGETTVSACKESQSGFTLLSDEPVVVEDLRTETRFTGPTMLHEHGVASGISVTIRAREHSYGVLGAHSTSVRRFTTDDVNFLVAVANVLAEAIDRKRAEESLLNMSRQLNATAQDYRRVIDNSLDVICTVDVAGRFTQVSKASSAVWGYSPDELVGHLSIDLVHPDDRPKTNQVAADVIAGQPTLGFENRYICRDGRAVDMMWSAVWSEKDQTMFTVARDVSEIRRGESERVRLLSELESEKTQLVNIFTHAPAFIASLRGPEHIFELANAHFYDLVGGPRDVIGMRVRDAFPELEDQGFFELLDNVYATGVPFVGDEMPVEFADQAGEPRALRYINFVYQPMTDTDGAVSGIICHGVDVTEQVLSRGRLQETENQLRQSQKLESVGMLAGGIAHDFNNLLTVITGYSELTLRGLDDADPLARNVEEIKAAAARAASLTRQLLAFSRKQLLQPKVLDLNSIIQTLETMLGRLVGEDMELRTSPCAGLGQVKADPGQIEQVILNLVVNARDAMPQGGKITLETANIYLDEAYVRRHIAVQPGWYVMLAVSDTGHGIDAETQKQIFEPFFTTKEQAKGTGLGLSTVYGIVKQSGGNIWVYSEVGLGTSFKIYLPMVHEEITRADEEVVPPESVLGTETILLAEDEEMVRRLARECLTMHGYRVLEAANGGEALLVCQQHEGPIHLLLTDVVMPRMSGKELAEHVVEMRPDTRVLYMSGYADQAIVHRGILDRDIAFIGKPFTPVGLVSKVGEVLRQKQSSGPSLKTINSPSPDGIETQRLSY